MNLTPLPRWNDLPAIDLYKEQVLEYLESVLSPLDVKPITASMINNYTKLKWLPAPHRKKYNRRHVAHILVIALLKDVFEISEIYRGIQMEKSLGDMSEGYDRFIGAMENALALMNRGFRIDGATPEDPLETPEERILRFAALSFALNRYTRQLMFNTPIQGETHD